MRYTPWLRVVSIALSIVCPTLIPAAAWAKDAKDDGQVAVVLKEDIRLLGRLNVNQATREELLLIPSLDAQKVDELIEARGRGALASLSAFTLPEEAVARLSNLRNDQLDEPVTYFDGQQLTVRAVLWTQLLHHLIHHRGQLVLLCRQAGGAPPGLFGPNREEMQAIRARMEAAKS